MPQSLVELIRHVHICTRSAAGLTGYNPGDLPLPSLPSLPPISAATAASHPSPSKLRCKNCKGTLLRGSESIICAYCGLAPHDGVLSDPISFTSTVGYQWLLRSLRLDGSEMVDQTHKTEQNQGYSSPKSLTPLFKFLNFKMSRPAKTEKQETILSENNSERYEGSLRWEADSNLPILKIDMNFQMPRLAPKVMSQILNPLIFLQVWGLILLLILTPFFGLKIRMAEKK